jgi:hypothetical protein
MLCVGVDVGKLTVGTHMRTWRVLTDRSSGEQKDTSPLDPALSITSRGILTADTPNTRVGCICFGP